jgi:hypothetical protein
MFSSKHQQVLNFPSIWSSVPFFRRDYVQPVTFPSCAYSPLPGLALCVTQEMEGTHLGLDDRDGGALTAELQPHDSVWVLHPHPQAEPTELNRNQRFPIIFVFENSLGLSSSNWSLSQRSRPFAEILATGASAVNKQKQWVNTNTFSEVKLREIHFPNPTSRHLTFLMVL